MVLFSKMEAVEKFGTNRQKSHFEKYGKFKCRDLENSLLETLKQHYESVEIVKDTKPYMYRLEGIRVQPVERQDGRKDNGKILEYQYELNSLVIDYLRQECTDQFFTYHSLSKWLTEMKLVSEDICYSQYNKNKQYSHLEQLQIRFPVEFTSNSLIPVENFTKIIMKRFKANLSTLFDKLAELDLIEYKKESMGCQLDDKPRPLTKEEDSQIKKLRRELRSKHGLTHKDSYREDINVNVERFNREFSVELESQFSIKYTFLSHSIRWLNGRIATRRLIYELIEEDRLSCQYGKYLLNDKRKDELLFDLNEKFSIKSILLAKEREFTEYRTDHTDIKYLKYSKMYTILWKKMLEYFELSHYQYELIVKDWDIG